MQDNVAFGLLLPKKKGTMQDNVAFGLLLPKKKRNYARQCGRKILLFDLVHQLLETMQENVD
jgi:hypothetical protein